MARITIDILRSNIYSIAEGISVAISQHNGGTPSYEQLWASEDEAPKLDIYYREAVGDLERNLMRWVRDASAQFDLTRSGTDYTLTLDINRYWPQKLQGLLANKIQDYLVHAVTAGWLNDFEGLSIKQDYKAIAVTDISDIHHIICQRSFDFQDGERLEDDSAKHEYTYQGDGRKGDDSAKHEYIPCQGNGRKGDDDKNTSEHKRQARIRREDDKQKKGGDDLPGLCRNRNLRHNDNTRERRNRVAVDVRQKDGECKDERYTLDGGRRHRDNAIVRHHHDYTDWSGTKTMPGCRTKPAMPPVGMNKGVLIKQQSPRVAHGMGCHPGHQRPPQPQQQEEKVYMTSGGMITAAQLNSDLLAKENVGKIYNVTEGFFPTSDFIEGVSDKRLQPGTNIQVVDVGTEENPVYMFDTFEAPKEEDVFIDIDESVVDNWF